MQHFHRLARCFQSKDSPDVGPSPVRDRNNIMGLPEIPRGHEQELRNANKLIRRMSILLHVATVAGMEFIVKNPADRGDRDLPHLFIDGQHGPVWLMPDKVTLSKSCHCERVTVAQCRFGGDAQKYTSFLYSPGFSPDLSYMESLRCLHGPNEHVERAGGTKANYEWESASLAAFVPALNFALAEACVGLARGSICVASDATNCAGYGLLRFISL